MAVTPGYVTSAKSSSNATTYTFSTTSIGTASSDRIVVVQPEFRSNGTNPTGGVTSLTVAGNSAAEQVQQISGRQTGSIWSLLQTTGTTADIVVNLADQAAQGGIGVWAMTGTGGNATASDTDKAAANNITGLTVPANGAAICGAFNGGPNAHTWSGASERYDVAVESAMQMSGADTTTSGTNTITATNGVSVWGAAWGPQAFSIAADVDSYALTGQATTPLHARKLTAEAGTLGITGTAASPEHGRLVDAGVSSYALTGQDASLVLSGGGSFSIVANPDSYAVTGDTASPLHARKVDAAPDSYAITGVTAALKHGWKVAAAAGSMAITGSDAAVRKDWRISAAAGSYGVSGSDASPELGRLLTALASSYGISGKIASLIWDAFVGEGGGIWIGDRSLPYGEADGEPGRNDVAAIAPLQSARGSANRNVVSGTGVKYRVNRPHT